MACQKFNSFDKMAMMLALEEAKKAFSEDEVPVGAVLSLENKIISTGYNKVHQLKDSSMHAEMICLRKGAEVLGDFRLLNCVLYTTLEPCAMCAGAIFNFRVKKVIWGAKDLRVGACGTLYNLFDGRHPIHKVDFESGLMEGESSSLLKMFFKNKRVKNE